MENLEISLTLTVNEVNAILKGLFELPFKESADLIAKVKTMGEAAMAAHIEKSKASADVEPAAEAA